MVQRPDWPRLWGDGEGRSSGVAWRRVMKESQELVKATSVFKGSFEKTT